MKRPAVALAQPLTKARTLAATGAVLQPGIAANSTGS
jgi:hypothetical protein